MAALIHIVDDDRDGAAATSFMLQQFGYETRTYNSGAEFLLAELDHGCVLLDMLMPEMDGFAVLAELGRRNLGLPVIIVTGNGDVPLAIRAMKRGAVDFLEKPFDAEEMNQAIQRALTVSAKTRQELRASAEAVARLKALTPREIQILQGLRAGMANKEIARWVDLSPRTVEVYRANMMAKIGAASLAQALRVARNGDLPPIEAARHLVRA